MKKIRILFYRTPWQAKLKFWINWLISIRTLSPFSHCEVWTADENGKFTELMERYVPAVDVEGNIDKTGSTQQQEIKLFCYGKCWTATMRGEANGTVVRDASGVLDHPERWRYIEVEVEDDDYLLMSQYMRIEVDCNKGYSKHDILKFISPIHFPDDKRNICSEFVNNALYFAGISKKRGIVSPAYIYKMLIKLGHKPKELK